MIRRYTVTENVVSILIALGIGSVICYNANEARKAVKPVIVPYAYSSYEREVALERQKEQEEIEAIINYKPTNIVATNVTEISEEVVTEPATVETETVKEAYFSGYTQQDIYLVGNTTFREVGVLFSRLPREEAKKAARLTASCLINRAKMNYKNLGSSIQAQLDPNQYASSSLVKNTKDDEVPEIFYEIAESILRDGPEVSEKLIFQSEFSQGKVIEHIDNQYFGLKE